MALMLARTQVKSLNLSMVDIVNIMVGTHWNSIVSSPSVSVVSQVSALRASSAVMTLMKMRECATHLEMTVNIAVITNGKILINISNYSRIKLLSCVSNSLLKAGRNHLHLTCCNCVSLFVDLILIFESKKNLHPD